MAAKTTPLAARLARGDEAAFAELYDVCAERLFGYLTRRLGCCHQAADVVQTTFVRAVQNRKQFASVENPAAYLFQMARNEVVRFVTRDKRHAVGQISIADVAPARNTTTDDDAEV